MKKCNLKKTFINVITMRKKNYNTFADEIKTYQQLIGFLLWITIISRPDIAQAINKCNRFTNNPAPQHEEIAKQIVRYLTNTKNLNIKYSENSGIDDELYDYIDSSHANCLDIKRLTFEFIFMLSNDPINWPFKKQTIVATFIIEIKYMTQCHAAQEAIYLLRALKFMKFYIETSITLYADNKSIINLTENNVNHFKSKHIDIQFHKIKKWIKNKSIRISYIFIAKMMTDRMTKSLPFFKFQQIVESMSMMKAEKPQKKKWE